MMPLRVAINGFGRIGRAVLRAIIESSRTDMGVVAINDIGPTESNAHLLKFDSIHGRFPGPISVGSDWIDVGQGPIKVTSLFHPAELPHAALGVDIVMECTGRFKTRQSAGAHLEAGAKIVLVSAPMNDADITVIFGVNHTQIRKEHRIISNASCTSNCLATVIKTLEGSLGIVHGFMTTVHSYTGDQPTLDTYHKDLYRARAAGLSIIPTSSGAIKAIELVFPELKGKLDCVAVRVPTPNVSLVDFKFVSDRMISIRELNEEIRLATSTILPGVVDYTDEANVSCDFNHNPHSAIFHLDQTRVVDDSLVRVVAWYDNEWGFSNRMLDVAEFLARHLV